MPTPAVYARKLKEEAKLKEALSVACNQWRVYAELEEDRDLASENTMEADQYRYCRQLAE